MRAPTGSSDRLQEFGGAASNLRGGPADAAPSGNLLRQATAASAALMRRRGAVLGLSLVSLVAIAVADLSTGYELALSLLYIAPVLAATWAFGLRAGVIVSLLATAAWIATDALAEHHYSLPIYRYWEGFIRLATFLLFALILDRLRRALARSDDRLLKVLEGLDAAVCVLDPAAGTILYRNRPFDTAFPSDARAEAARRLLGAVVELPSADAGTELAFGERWFLVRGRWLSWIDERPVLLLSATDVTERRRTEALNREQALRLQASARLVAFGEIASSIAHELNQPLTAIASYVLGCLRRLRAGNADAQALAGALEQAGAQADRAGQIIRRVRDFVRSRQPVLAPVDLNDVVERAAATLTLNGERDAGRLRLVLAPGLPPAQADALMIEQVVLNLAQNGLEATDETAHAHLPVEVFTTQTAPDRLEVTVADRGPGVAPEMADRLFEPFCSTKVDGMGLGLNICRSIIEFHGGHLWTSARDGGGAEFHFTLRVAPREP